MISTSPNRSHTVIGSCTGKTDLQLQKQVREKLAEKNIAAFVLFQRLQGKAIVTIDFTALVPEAIKSFLELHGDFVHADTRGTTIYFKRSTSI